MEAGKGVWKYSNGDVLEGIWKGGEVSGKGVQQYANGDVLDSEWKVNMRVGKGVMTLVNGDVLKCDEWLNVFPNDRSEKCHKWRCD